MDLLEANIDLCKLGSLILYIVPQRLITKLNLII